MALADFTVNDRLTAKIRCSRRPLGSLYKVRGRTFGALGLIARMPRA
jgi:hypothetical protein